ncbi:helix-turn-helix domain-containing protein [Vibrio sp. Of7-15]|uniref:helix-turn-helix domain-containing protein n=1 Tax=Vibrio sp. Of7-15 TaxID=2724879 RepID=UPI001EF2FF4F|nr:helix-turn-helix domain-containing protein [Vibrio sp. Of7-15]MCG7497765.1 helix-turn-helix domain-containing protein [Vibrio sp. Of7-15]
MHPSQDVNMKEIAKLLPMDYQGGKDVTTRLLKILNLAEYRSLSDAFDVSWGTISTWHRREQTPFEIAVRTHLATGASLRWILLGEGEMFESGQPIVSSNNIDVPYYTLADGILTDEGTMSFDPKFLADMPEKLMLVEHDNQKIFINTSIKKAVSATYLVKIDDDYSICELQKLPGGKVVMHFNGSNYEVATDELEVVGKVV